MARAPNEKAIKAFELYKQGMRLVDIANQLNVPAGTVRRWKSTLKWNNERSDNKNERSKKKSERSDKKNEQKKEVIVDEVNQVLENAKLTDKQRLFCLYYIKCFNATKAYQKAYECDEYSARANAARLIANDSIKDEIKRLKQGRLNKAMLEAEDIFEKYMAIAFADITEYTKFGQKEITYIDKKGNEHSATVSYVDLKESKQVDGTIITEISQGKEGVKIKLADRMKALQWLADHMDLATEEQRARIDILKSKIQTEEDLKDINKGIINIADILQNPMPNRILSDNENKNEDDD